MTTTSPKITTSYDHHIPENHDQLQPSSWAREDGWPRCAVKGRGVEAETLAHFLLTIMLMGSCLGACSWSAGKLFVFIIKSQCFSIPFETQIEKRHDCSTFI